MSRGAFNGLKCCRTVEQHERHKARSKAYAESHKVEVAARRLESERVLRSRRKEAGLLVCCATAEAHERHKARSLAYYAANRDEAHARDRDYYLANREKIIAYQRRYYRANREKVRERDRAYRVAHREEIRERDREYRAAHPDKRKRQRSHHPRVLLDPAVAHERKLARTREWYARNQEASRAYAKEYRLRHLEALREKNRAYSRESVRVAGQKVYLRALPDELRELAELIKQARTVIRERERNQ